jgi:uncharacterized membrane protein
MSEEPNSYSPYPQIEAEVTSDDKLWAFLAYILSPFIPIVILLMEDKKERPFIKAHNMQALVLGLINMVIWIILGWTFILTCIPLIIWLVMVYWGIQAYQGKYVTVPVVTEFVNKQGWV